MTHANDRRALYIARKRLRQFTCNAPDDVSLGHCTTWTCDGFYTYPNMPPALDRAASRSGPVTRRRRVLAQPIQVAAYRMANPPSSDAVVSNLSRPARWVASSGIRSADAM